ncbi:hypothetical protein K7X08_005694 [Anisodus acutangulus]|uniref:Mitochondrial Rho GTPase n=1 Tax=Anisodus acutangulus TaxID=402998 RepID=A0A9Q1R7H5_9SOLA|nr:hypothetical protein K7X08_005694 [Anisodus acutangulus]
MLGGSISGGRTNVRVVVIGDRATGKSSLITAVATANFPEEVLPVLPPIRLPADLYPDNVPVTITDTSSSLGSRGKVAEELKRADAVVLTYACDQPATLNRLTTFWLYEFGRLEIRVPVIVVGCKLDQRDEEHHMNLDQVMAPIKQQFREIETCIECSAANLVQVPEVFYYAQKAVLHPIAPLFDHETQALKPRCVRALKRIFILCDHDMDDALSDEELNEFQIKCFNAPLQPAEIVGVKRVVQEKLPQGVNDLGLRLIRKGRFETTWTVLRKFGYNDEIKLKDDSLTIPFKKAPDQSLELTSEAVEFLKGVFSIFDTDKDGVLRNSELDALFSTDAVERTTLGGLSLSAFLSEWALMTLLEPAQSLANLIFIGYNCGAASALRLTRRSSVDIKKQQTDRNVYQGFVFGPKGSGKSALLKSLLGRFPFFLPFSENYAATTDEHYAVNVVDRLGRTKKTLVLREIPEDEVKMLLSNKESLASCDVAVVVYDSSDEYSLKRASELLMTVVRRGEVSGFMVPCLFVAAKDDLDSYPMAIKDSAKICQNFGIDAPIHISVKERDLNSVFNRIITAAEHPHLSVPETEVGRSQKRYRHLVNRFLMLTSVVAAVAVAGLAAYRSYAARKNTSS